MNLQDLPLGSLIVRDGIARPATVRDALVEAQETDRRLGEVMLARGWIRERDLARLLAEQEKLEFIDLAKIDLDDAPTTSRSRRPPPEGDRLRLPQLGAPRRRRRPDRRGRPGRGPRGRRRRVKFKVALPSEIDSALYDAYGDPLVASA